VFDGRDLLTVDPREAAEDIRGRAITFVPQDRSARSTRCSPSRSDCLSVLALKVSPIADEGKNYPRARRRSDANGR